VLLQILSGTKNASDLLPAGSVYGLEPNKSVELTIPGGAIGGPVCIPFAGIWRQSLTTLNRFFSNSIPFIFTAMRSTWSAVLAIRRTTL
jgi:hypothetical protein